MRGLAAVAVETQEQPELFGRIRGVRWRAVLGHFEGVGDDEFLTAARRQIFFFQFAFNQSEQRPAAERQSKNSEGAQAEEARAEQHGNSQGSGSAGLLPASSLTCQGFPVFAGSSVRSVTVSSRVFPVKSPIKGPVITVVSSAISTNMVKMVGERMPSS